MKTGVENKILFLCYLDNHKFFSKKSPSKLIISFSLHIKYQIVAYKIVSAFGFFIPDVQLLLDQAVHDDWEDDVPEDETKDL